MKQLHKVLVVDDDPTSRFLIARTIKRVGAGQEVLTANNGEEALELLADVCFTDTCPELILLDINMPIMNGFEFLEALQHSDLFPLPSKIVLLTSSTDSQDVIRAKRYPIAAYLTKPLTDDGFKNIII